MERPSRIRCGSHAIISLGTLLAVAVGTAAFVLRSQRIVEPAPARPAASADHGWAVDTLRPRVVTRTDDGAVRTIYVRNDGPGKVEVRWNAYPGEIRQRVLPPGGDTGVRSRGVEIRLSGASTTGAQGVAITLPPRPGR